MGISRRTATPTSDPDRPSISGVPPHTDAHWTTIAGPDGSRVGVHTRLVWKPGERPSRNTSSRRVRPRTAPAREVPRVGVATPVVYAARKCALTGRSIIKSLVGEAIKHEWPRRTRSKAIAPSNVRLGASSSPTSGRHISGPVSSRGQRHSVGRLSRSGVVHAELRVQREPDRRHPSGSRGRRSGRRPAAQTRHEPPGLSSGAASTAARQVSDLKRVRELEAENAKFRSCRLVALGRAIPARVSKTYASRSRRMFRTDCICGRAV